MIDQINELPEDGLKSSPETSRYTENKWISWKNQNKLYFLHLIGVKKVYCHIWTLGKNLYVIFFYFKKSFYTILFLISYV